MCKVWLCFLLIITLLVINPVVASPEKLRQLELGVQKLQAQMHNTRTQYGRLQRQLQHHEEDIGEVAQHLELLHSALVDKKNTLAYLEKQQQALQIQFDTQRQVLAKQIRAAYIMGRQNYLKLWLNQESPFSIGRILTYSDYFNRARTQQITNIKTTWQRLETLELTIKSEKTDLNQRIKEKKDKKQQLKLSYKERQKILVQLANTLKSQDKKLKRLQEEKLRLEVLLGTIEDTLKDIPQPQNPQIPFAKLKGQLPYPVQGKVVKRFGEKLVSHLKWQGMLIKASFGKKVRAVAAGRVVFAQWFPNLGLLVILDHGEGYMSLYAHNQSLYIQTGNWVKPNDIIATVGNSGGRKTLALYFEIRHQGVPKPPRKWLRKP
jgi:septal ring factor EnvC (AmiA/AmiB activator)